MSSATTKQDAIMPLEKRVAANRNEDFSSEEIIGIIIDGLRRTMVHYGLWFKESECQIGMEDALRIEKASWDREFPLAMKRLSKVLGFSVAGDGVPLALRDKSREELLVILKEIAVNWLANDGLWFQSLEEQEDMFCAKRINDTCWSKFSPYEAFRIKDLLRLPDMGGLEGLKKALGRRLYAFINKQSIIEEGANSLVFQMNECRVQYARKRKGLDDYPCKSGGIVEYSTFARAIDSRITTECIACPPDTHPREWYCSWRFTIPD